MSDETPAPETTGRPTPGRAVPTGRAARGRRASDRFGRWPESALPSPAQLVGLIVVLVLTYATVIVIRSLRSVLVMLLVSLFIAFAVEPAVQWLGRHGWRRGPATAVVFLGAILALVASFGSIIPLLVDQVSDLLRTIPRSVDELNSLLSRIPYVDLQLDPDANLNQELIRIGRELSSGGIAQFATGNVLGAAGSVVGIGATALGVIFQGLTVLLVSFYMVADGPRFRAALARPLPPHRQREMLAIWEIAVAKTGGYIYSRVLIAAVAATVTAVFLLVIGVPYPLPLGLWVGVTGAFVPVVGTYLGGVLIVIVALIHDPILAIWVLIFLAVYQQIENYLIAPRLQAATMDIHPAVAFVSVIIGATLLGAVGALLALPATAIIQAVSSTYMQRHALIDELSEISDQLHADDDHPARDPRTPDLQR
ncbi:AI-2E family transporter [Euzebya sp.]|uniref:AI-2E family transporter n=1 Tax=Euzebya sp. TaxID=1971409 RepID=UPI0035133630